VSATQASFDNSARTERCGAAQTLSAVDRRDGVIISVNWIDTTTYQASVTISGDVALRCLQGYVWREAFLGDFVCVTPDVRSQASADNAAASARVAHA
jgi:hypothetical protein